MTISEVVQSVITSDTRTVSQKGFGVPMLAIAHDQPERVLTYTTLKEMTDAGWGVDSTGYLMASRMKAQNPSIETWKIGKRTNVFARVLVMGFLNTDEGFVYSLTFTYAGVSTLISYTVPAAASAATISAAITPLITALSGDITAADLTGTLSVTLSGTGVGELLNIAGADARHVTLLDTTVDAGLAADLAAIESADSDWYCLLLDSQSAAEASIAAAFVEARPMIFALHSFDTGCTDALSTTDTFYTINALNYRRTIGLFHLAATAGFAAAGWAGALLPLDPGSATWAHKNVVGIAADSLTGSMSGAVEAKQGNTYREIGGLSVATYGTSFGESGTYIDDVIFDDWLDARLQESVFTTMANAKKIPYTNKGIALIVADVYAVLARGVLAGGIDGDRAITVTVPDVSEIPKVDKTGRILRTIEWSAYRAGAIHKVRPISGSLTV